MGEGPRATSTRTAGGLAVLVTAALLPFGATQLDATTSFVPALISVVSCFDLLSVYLLVGAYRDRGELRQLVMALAYAWSLVTMTGYAFAFPGAVSSEPPLASAPSTAPYLYLLWHCGFPVILGLAWMPWPRRFPLMTPSVQRARTAAVTVATTVLAAAVTVVTVVLAAPGLPTLIVGLDTSRMTRLTAPVVLPLVVLALVACGLVLTGSCRSNDVVARVGGEEFLILLPDTDEAGTMSVAGKMRSAVAGIAIPALEWPLTASLGVTMLGADETGADLLRRADEALYAAKAGGRDRAMLADADV